MFHRSFLHALVASILWGVATPQVLRAQVAGNAPKEETLPVTEAVRQLRMLHVSPNRVILDPGTTSATVEFSNMGDKPVQGEVQVLFAFMDYPRGKALESALFSKQWETLMPHDSVMLNPGPNDRFAGRWISGLPTQLTLAPKEKRRVTLKISPPANLPDGEYWARVVTVVRPPEPNRNKAKPKDERTIYALPIKGQSPPMLRDSVQVFFRKGQLKMGIRGGPGAVAAIDTIGLDGPPDIGRGNRRLWVRLPLELTGNAHFDGVWTMSYRNTKTGATVPLTPGPMVVYRNAVTHWWLQADMLPAGSYEVSVLLTAPQDDTPAARRLPVEPVTIKIPFEIQDR